MKMNKYYLFAGDFYYPTGGIDDYITTLVVKGDDAAIDKANEILVENNLNGEYKWAHLVLADSMRKIWDF